MEGVSMSRTKGSLNKQESIQIDELTLSSDERIRLLARIIVDRIEADKRNGEILLRTIERPRNARSDLSTT